MKEAHIRSAYDSQLFTPVFQIRSQDLHQRLGSGLVKKKPTPRDPEMTNLDFEILDYDTEQIIEAINEVTGYDTEYESHDDGEHFFWYLDGNGVERPEDILSLDQITAVNKYLKEEFDG